MSHERASSEHARSPPPEAKEAHKLEPRVQLHRRVRCPPRIVDVRVGGAAPHEDGNGPLVVGQELSQHAAVFDERFLDLRKPNGRPMIGDREARDARWPERDASTRSIDAGPKRAQTPASDGVRVRLHVASAWARTRAPHRAHHQPPGAPGRTFAMHACASSKLALCSVGSFRNTTETGLFSANHACQKEGGKRRRAKGNQQMRARSLLGGSLLSGRPPPPPLFFL